MVQINENKEKEVVVNNSVIINNWRKRPQAAGIDFSKSIVEHFHMERSANGGLNIVSDGFVDHQKEINSQAKNAGLANILKLQELKYGSLVTAIEKNAEHQLYADVSDIPHDVASQAEYIKQVEASVDALCSRLGITRDQLLNLDETKFNELTAVKEGNNNE